MPRSLGGCDHCGRVTCCWDHRVLHQEVCPQRHDFPEEYLIGGSSGVELRDFPRNELEASCATKLDEPDEMEPTSEEE